MHLRRRYVVFVGAYYVSLLGFSSSSFVSLRRIGDNLVLCTRVN